MASHFSTKHVIFLVNIEFDGIKKKKKRCPPVGGPEAVPTEIAPLSGGWERAGSGWRRDPGVHP